MRIDVIGAVLRVVFNHEDCGVLPELRFADSIDEQPECEVVLGDHRGRRRLADPRAGGVVVRQTHDRQLRHRAIDFIAADLAQEAFRALHVEVIEVVAAEVWVEVPFECLDRCAATIVRAIGFLLAVLDPFAVAAVADAGFLCAVPNVTAGGPRDAIHRAFGRVAEGAFRTAAVA